MRGIENDRAWAEAFFARQREEILAAVRAERARARARRRAGIALAAAALLLVLLPWSFLPAPRPGEAPAAATVASTSFDDPLAAYDPWDEPGASLEFPDVPGAGLARFLAGEDPSPAADDGEAPPPAGGARKG